MPFNFSYVKEAPEPPKRRERIERTEGDAANPRGIPFLRNASIKLLEQLIEDHPARRYDYLTLIKYWQETKRNNTKPRAKPKGRSSLSDEQQRKLVILYKDDPTRSVHELTRLCGRHAEGTAAVSTFLKKLQSGIDPIRH